MKSKLIPVLAGLAAVGFVVTVFLVFTYAPLVADPVLMFNQKIYYYHVSHAFMLFIATVMCGVCSLAFLKTRKPKWDDLALASAEVAALFGAVVLVTGILWAKAAWDVWWVWEKRLTMSLLLWLVLVGYVLVRRFAGASADRIAAGLAVFGTVGIPFIYFMVDASDHHPQAGAQGVVATQAPGIRLVFWLSVLTFLLWFCALVASRVQTTRAERELREIREKGLDAGLFT